MYGGDITDKKWQAGVKNVREHTVLLNQVVTGFRGKFKQLM